MADDPKQVENPAPSGEPKGLSNHDVKNHPLFTRLANETAELKQKLQAIEDEKAKAASDKKIKEAESKQNYETALAEAKANFDKELKGYQAQTRRAELKAEILKQGGVGTKGFVDTALAEFTSLAEPQEIEAFVTQLKSNEDYKLFFEAKTSKFAPPQGGKVDNTSSGAMTDEKALAWENSDDPEKRAAVRQYYYQLTKEGRPLPKRK